MGSVLNREHRLGKVIVTQPNLVPSPGRPYDARNLAQAGGEGRDAGKLSLEAQTQA